MARTGPNPPDMDWTRLDLRGINSTRYAWGYISPQDEIIVKDDGSVYVLVDQASTEKLPKKPEFRLKVQGRTARLLKRALRWSKLVKEFFDFSDDVTEDDTVEGFNPPPPPPKPLAPPSPPLKLDPPNRKSRKETKAERKKRLKISRYGNEDDWYNL